MSDWLGQCLHSSKCRHFEERDTGGRPTLAIALIRNPARKQRSTYASFLRHLPHSIVPLCLRGNFLGILILSAVQTEVDKSMETGREHEELVQWLRTPQAYSHAPESVQHTETHISHVFLAGEYVYKLKKPVKYDFLDFSSVGSREHACREELRLNQRLASDVYLRVVPVVRSADGRLELAEADAAVTPAAIVDWLVQMRRLPTTLTLDALHRRGELRPEHIERLADKLVRFYRSLAPLSLLPEQYRGRYVEHVRANWHELGAERHHLERTIVQRVHGFQLQLLQLAAELFDERVRSGLIVDGHGDLRPEHICLSDPIAIFDCIEFNDELRQIDEVDELAFLTAECDCLGARWMGPRLIEAYQAASGDIPPAILYDFYKSYRACVRSKVAALRADQIIGQARRQADEEAAARLALAGEYVEPWLRPLVLIVGGMSGTGKTTLASALANSLGANLLRTDVLRQEIFGAGPHVGETNSGIYQPEARLRVYREMISRLDSLHGERISAVLDGTFSTVRAIREVQAAVQHPRAIFCAVECMCSTEVARERIGMRLAREEDVSDARPELHDIQHAQWEEWPADIPTIRVDTEQVLDVQLQQVLQTLSTSYRL